MNLSVVWTKLVNFSGQVTIWWRSESSRSLIGAYGICIGFINIVALVGRIRFIHLLFRHHLSALLVILSDTPVILSSGGVSVLVIIDYWHYHQLFLHWRSKILIWVQLSVNICVTTKEKAVPLLEGMKNSMEQVLISGSSYGCNKCFYTRKSQVLQLNGAGNFKRRRKLCHKGWIPVCLFFIWDPRLKHRRKMGLVSSSISGARPLMCLNKPFYLKRFGYSWWRRKEN